MGDATFIVFPLCAAVSCKKKKERKKEVEVELGYGDGHFWIGFFEGKLDDFL